MLRQRPINLKVIRNLRAIGYEAALKAMMIRNDVDVRLKILIAVGAFLLCVTESITPLSRYAPVFYHLARGLEEKNRKAKAIDYYRKAVYHNPRFSSAYEKLAIIILDRGDNMSAFQYLMKAAVYEPSFFEDFHKFGLCYIQRRDYPLAILCFETAIQKFHRNEDRYLLGLAYIKEGQLDRAHSLAKELYVKGDASSSKKLHDLVLAMWEDYYCVMDSKK